MVCPSATKATTVATGIRKPRRHGTPPICLGLVVTRVNSMPIILDGKDGAAQPLPPLVDLSDFQSARVCHFVPIVPSDADSPDTPGSRFARQIPSGWR